VLQRSHVDLDFFSTAPYVAQLIVLVRGFNAKIKKFEKLAKSVPPEKFGSGGVGQGGKPFAFEPFEPSPTSALPGVSGSQAASLADEWFTSARKPRPGRAGKAYAAAYTALNIVVLPVKLR
jgi:hypothetical protein